MSVLTEDCVLSRTRAQDLKSVRKLNCWGSELEDVSIVRQMPHVEVLSLSVNNIYTLADFAHCKNLQELYIRKNSIQDLNEVLYLKDLPRLKSLWLADNPCAENEQYRLTVLRHLPNLQKLDNQIVQSHEVERARVQGLCLVLPTLSSDAVHDDQASVAPHAPRPAARATQAHQNGSEDLKAVVSHPRTLDLPSMEPTTHHRPATVMTTPTVSMPSTTEPKLAEAACSPIAAPVVHDGQVPCQEMSPAEQHAFHARVQTLMDHSGRRLRKSAEIACDPVALFEGEEAAGTRQGSTSLSHGRRYSSVEYLHTHSLDSDSLMSPGETGGRGSAHTEVHRAHKGDKPSPTRLLPKGGKNRNANILSAVLCLIKELDYASLEVVETAIHCRMEEMDA